MGIGSRFKEIRKAQGQSQTEFAESLGVTRGVVSNIELGKIENLTTKMPFFRLVCDRYGINLDWLMHGTGEMIEDVSRDDEIITSVSEIFVGEDQFKKDLISVLVKLPEEHWSVLAEFAAEMLKKQEERNKKDQGD